MDSSDFAQGFYHNNYASSSAISTSYVEQVQKAITDLEKNINEHQYINQGIKQFKGYVAEEYTAGTYNIDAIASGSKDRAIVNHENSWGSVDIHTTESNIEVSSKVYKTARDSAKQQYAFDSETGKSKYYEQKRLIADDQTGKANKYLDDRYENIDGRTKEGRALKETRENITSQLKNDEGVQSKKFTKKETEDIAKEAKENENGFKAKDHGVTANTAITEQYILKQSFKTGCTAAAVSFAIAITPKVLSALDYLIKTGEVDPDLLQNGAIALGKGAEGFLSGFVTSELVIHLEKALADSQLFLNNPVVVGALVSIVMSTIKDCIAVSKGHITKREMCNRLVDNVAITASYMIGAKIGGAIVQALAIEFPGVGFLLGSAIGFGIAAAYNQGKKLALALCVDTGFTFFGLVEQDYTLPAEVLKEIGIEVFDYEDYDYSQFECDTIDIPRFNVDRFEADKFDIVFLRRGVIGISKVGYV